MMTIMHPHHLLLLLLPPHSPNNAPTLARNNQLLSKHIFQSKDAYHSIPFATPPICPSVPTPCSLSNASRKQMTQETTYKLRLSSKITTKTQKHHRSQEFPPSRSHDPKKHREALPRSLFFDCNKSKNDRRRVM
jgi:hypothetical protein